MACCCSDPLLFFPGAAKASLSEPSPAQRRRLQALDAPLRLLKELGDLQHAYFMLFRLCKIELKNEQLTVFWMHICHAVSTGGIPIEIPGWLFLDGCSDRHRLPRPCLLCRGLAMVLLFCESCFRPKSALFLHFG